jgi:cathepsin A (carboxypeptidase C)
VTFAEYEILKKGFSTCQDMILNTTADWLLTLEYCELTMMTVLGNPLAPRFNVYDIREKCNDPPLCYNFSNSDVYLNNATVQAKLGVSGRQWVECNKNVHTALLGDWNLNMASKISAVLESGLNVLVYSGDKDWVCNWRGGEAWTNAVEWSGQSHFNTTSYKDWIVNGQAAGQLKKYNNLSFLRVYNAGHMVPMN